MEIPLIIKNPPLDFELSELLGEKPSEFVVLCIDGEQVPFLGTPWNSPRTRENYRAIIEWLNDHRRKDWAELFKNWRYQFITHYKLPEDTTAESYHPKFTLAVSRVCAGYSTHLHVAIGVFETLGDRISSWSVAKADDGTETVEMVATRGPIYRETGTGLARLITQAAVRMLRDQPNIGSETTALETPQKRTAS